MTDDNQTQIKLTWPLKEPGDELAFTITSVKSLTPTTHFMIGTVVAEIETLVRHLREEVRLDEPYDPGALAQAHSDKRWAEHAAMEQQMADDIVAEMKLRTGVESGSSE